MAQEDREQRSFTIFLEPLLVPRCLWSSSPPAPRLSPSLDIKEGWILYFPKMVLQDTHLPSSWLAGFSSKVAFLSPTPCHEIYQLSCGE